jgi:hypothetical protein
MEGAYENAKDIFMNRVLKHNEDKLFFTDYAKEESILLEKKAIKRMNYWKRIIENPNMV